MWRISDVSVVRDAGDKEVRVMSANFTPAFMRVFARLSIVLSNEETGEDLSFYWVNERWRSAVKTYYDFIDSIKKFSPYGLVKHDNGYLLVAVDELALKFTEYIESVDILPKNEASSLLVERRLNRGAVDFVDKERSFIDPDFVNFRGMRAMPLLEFCAFDTVGWIGDFFYFRSVENVYRISFTDSAEARKFVTKVRLMKHYEPFLSRIRTVEGIGCC